MAKKKFTMTNVITIETEEPLTKGQIVRMKGRIKRHMAFDFDPELWQGDPPVAVTSVKVRSVDVD